MSLYKHHEQFDLRVAGREFARLFASVKTLPKTLTEAVTNSDSSYKRKLNLPHASGLVDLILKQEKGHILDSANLAKELVGKSPTREIFIYLYSAAAERHAQRTCEIVDYAEGLTYEELKKAFREYAGDKSEVAKHRPGRSLFGRGVSDVLFTHNNGKFVSLKNNIINTAKFHFDPSSPPNVTLESLDKDSKMLTKYHLENVESGSTISLMLDKNCTIPQEGNIGAVLSQFYMLRLINSDPNTNIKLIQYRASGRKEADLSYSFPTGPIVEKINFSKKFFIDGQGFNVSVEAIIARADIDGKLPGKEDGDLRANGLLIVDEHDAVLDLTFLPEYENAPYLANIFGLIRLTGIRDLLFYCLEMGKQATSPLTVTRDGFDPSHPITKELFNELRKYLVPFYNREEEKYNKKHAAQADPLVRDKLKDALKEINKYLKELLGYDGGPIIPTDTQKDIIDIEVLGFVPESTTLISGVPRIVQLIAKMQLFKDGSIIMISSTNPNIEVFPETVNIGKGKTKDELSLVPIKILCDVVEEKGEVVALAELKEGELKEARIKIVDVIQKEELKPPETMDFSPNPCKSRPNRVKKLSLLINTAVVPIGRKIKLYLENIRGDITLFFDGKKSQSDYLKLEKNHLIKGTKNLAKMMIPWIGSGWAQSARIVAETKGEGGEILKAIGKIQISESEEEAGLVRDVKYLALEEEVSQYVAGVIYINSKHPLNYQVFGDDIIDYEKKVKEDRTAQYRLGLIILEESISQLAEKAVSEGKVIKGAPVTDIRRFIDQHTKKLAPKVLKVIMAGGIK